MNDIHKTIRSSGGRLTKIKNAILEILSKSDCLVAKKDIVKGLQEIGIKPDRSTIYRELTFLLKNNLVIKNTIAGVDYYEIPQDHHHHLICVRCNRITKVVLTNHLALQEKQIAQQNKFSILTHSLEFYGYCQQCQV